MFGTDRQIQQPDLPEVRLMFVYFFGISFAGSFLTSGLAEALKKTFIHRGISGIDYLKKDKPIISSSGGSLSGLVYLIIVIISLLFIPKMKTSEAPCSDPLLLITRAQSGLLALSCMLFLGFVDDVFDLRWRVKLILPIIATVPILVVTYTTLPLGCVRLPTIVIKNSIASLFSTNSINILAGANGVEISQTIVILISMIAWMLIDLITSPQNIGCVATGLHFSVPFVFVSAGLLAKNWYPAEIFPGNTYCYMAGMVIAVTAILNNSIHIVGLHLIPQIFNFLYSCPQLFKIIPCPRHRMPRLLGSRVHYSVFKYNKEVKPSGRLVLMILEKIRLAKIERNHKGLPIYCNNLTLINLILLHFGPMEEQKIAKFVIAVQVLSSFLGFLVLYPCFLWIFKIPKLKTHFTLVDSIEP